CLWQVDRPDEGLARLSHVVEDVRRWSPADGELTTRIDEAFAAVAGSAVPGRAARTLPDAGTTVEDLVRSVPEPFKAQAHEALSRRRHPPRADVHRRMLAAHAFANWTAHLGEGLRTWLRSI